MVTGGGVGGKNNSIVFYNISTSLLSVSSRYAIRSKEMDASDWLAHRHRVLDIMADNCSLKLVIITHNIALSCFI